MGGKYTMCVQIFWKKKYNESSLEYGLSLNISHYAFSANILQVFFLSDSCADITTKHADAQSEVLIAVWIKLQVLWNASIQISTYTQHDRLNRR
jgi:hypothetical protein